MVKHELLGVQESPEDILERSHGEVTEPETINHRTYRPEPKGLLCERIFGPNEDWTCGCKKYEGIKYKNNVCDRCGVEVNERKEEVLLKLVLVVVY